MKIKNAAISLVSVFLLFATAFAGDRYDIDTAHTNITFSVKHLMLSKVTGKFSQFSGSIIYDEKDVTKSSVEVEIDVASIDTDNDKRDKHLKSAGFLDAANHPKIIFKSKRQKSNLL